MKKIFILCLSIFLLTGCSLKKNPIAEKITNKAQEKIQSYTLKSLKAAVELGIPLKCSYKINDFEYEGYLKGKSWRGKMSQMDKTTNIIMKDNCMYAWTDETPQGTKMCFEEDIWESEDSQFEQPNMEYICSPAVFGDEKFTPPSSINFMDLDDINSMMQQQIPTEQMPEDFPTDEMMAPGLPMAE